MKVFRAVLMMAMFVLMANAGCNHKTEVDMSNPFFSQFDTPFNVPPFEKIMAKHYMPAFEKGMEEGRKGLAIILNSSEEPTFQNTIDPLDSLGSLLTKVSSVFFSQASASTSDSLQKIEVEISPKLSEYRDEILLSPLLFNKVKTIYENRDSFKLDDEQRFLLENLYRNFVRNGALLDRKSVV